MFVRDNFEIESIDRVYIFNLPSQLTLFARGNSCDCGDLSMHNDQVRLVNTCLVRETRKFESKDLYTFLICLIKSRCLYDSTLRIGLTVYLRILTSTHIQFA
jgi:hypothetical protein